MQDEHGAVPPVRRRHLPKRKRLGKRQAPRRVKLNIRKHFCAVHVTEHWHRFLTEAGESSSLEMSKSHLDVVLGTMLWVALLEQGLDQMDPEVSPTSAIL